MLSGRWFNSILSHQESIGQTTMTKLKLQEEIKRQSVEITNLKSDYITLKHQLNDALSDVRRLESTLDNVETLNKDLQNKITFSSQRNVALVTSIKALSSTL